MQFLTPAPDFTGTRPDDLPSILKAMRVGDDAFAKWLAMSSKFRAGRTGLGVTEDAVQLHAAEDVVVFIHELATQLKMNRTSGKRRLASVAEAFEGAGTERAQPLKSVASRVYRLYREAS